jgi:hypothetical protein
MIIAVSASIPFQRQVYYFRFLCKRFFCIYKRLQRYSGMLMAMLVFHSFNSALMIL